MMRRNQIGLAALAVLPACGGVPASTHEVPPSAAGREPLPAVDVWAGVLAGGVTYTLVGDGGVSLRVDVDEGRTLGKGQTVGLGWSVGGVGHSGAPWRVAASAEVVHLINAGPDDAGLIQLLDSSVEDSNVLEDLGVAWAWPRRPRTVPSQTRADGQYSDVWRGGDDVVVCFGEGPPPNAELCEDVCFAELCVSSKAGIVEVDGTWAPNFGRFTAAGYERFRETMTRESAPAD